MEAEIPQHTFVNILSTLKLFPSDASECHFRFHALHSKLKFDLSWSWQKKKKRFCLASPFNLETSWEQALLKNVGLKRAVHIFRKFLRLLFPSSWMGHSCFNSTPHQTVSTSQDRIKFDYDDDDKDDDDDDDGGDGDGEEDAIYYFYEEGPSQEN